MECSEKETIKSNVKAARILKAYLKEILDTGWIFWIVWTSSVEWNFETFSYQCPQARWRTI